MKVGVFTVTASLGKQAEIGRRIFEKTRMQLKGLENYVEFSNLITSATSAQTEVRELKDKITGGVVVVCTGGTDHMIRSVAIALREPTLVFAHPLNNSLASVREALAVLSWEGRDVDVTYGSLENLRGKVEPFIMAVIAAHKLGNARLGIVGNPEPWLMTTRDRQLIKRRLGAELVNISWEELLEVAKRAHEPEVSRKVKELKSQFGRTAEPSDEDLAKAIRLYLAMKELVKRYNLNAMAVEAKDMIEPSLIDWGPYLGVSLMSDEGIPADYEVDHDGILTKLIIHLLAGVPSFMANITRVDESRNTVVLSHCTIPTSMIDAKSSVLRSYYETNKSVAIRGKLSNGARVTFARIGGKQITEMMVATGKIVNGDMGSEDLCRTQVEVETDGRAWDVIDKSLGNHMVLAYGDLTPHLLAFCKIKGIKPILI